MTFISQLSLVDIVLRSLLTASGLSIVYFFVRLYQVRTHVRNLSKKHGIGIMPHSFLWGHLKILGECMNEMPSNVYGSYLTYQLLKRFPELDQGLYYIDSWPFQDPMVAVHDPDMVAQFTSETSMPKATGVRDEFVPLTGGRDILCLDGQDWKHWRSMFNPAFSTRNLTAMMPKIIEEAIIFRDILAKATTTDDVFLMECATSNFGMDVVGHLVLGDELRTQTAPNSTMAALRRQIGLMGYGFRLSHYNPMTYVNMWKNTGMMNIGFTSMVNRYFSPVMDTKNNLKTIVGLAQNFYASNEGKQQADSKVLYELLPQLKLFMIAGYDTTGIVLAFAYYNLATNPSVLAALRKEHDEVLGPVEKTADAIAMNPSLANKLPYTTGVIKESLRMYPPVSTIRSGGPTKALVDTKGKKFPSEGFNLWSSAFDFQTSKDIWHRPMEFLPERWVVRDESDPLYNGPHTKNAFRPFEMGPRACIGQELAMMDMRVAFALTVREFDFADGYPTDAPKLMGSPCYNAQLPGEITGHCSLRCPLKISVRKH